MAKAPCGVALFYPARGFSHSGVAVPGLLA